jgi:hypothetical protein
VLGQDRSKHARDNVANLKLSTALRGDPFSPGPVSDVSHVSHQGFK